MPINYNPSNWYWVVAGSNTQVFASARNAYASNTDATYVAWVAAGNRTTPIDTEANLIAVLTAAGVNVTVPSIAGLSSYLATATANKLASGITVAGFNVPTDPTSIALYSTLNIAAAVPTFTFPWQSGSGSYVTLTAAQISAVYGAVNNYVAAVKAVQATTASSIASGTITTTAAIDSAYAAVSNSMAVPIPQSITRRQFYSQLVVLGTITQNEALATNAGTVPSELAGYVAALPTGQQFAANMALGGQALFYRNGPITLAVANSLGWTSTQVDTFFTAAAAL